MKEKTQSLSTPRMPWQRTRRSFPPQTAVSAHAVAAATALVESESLTFPAAFESLTFPAAFVESESLTFSAAFVESES